MVSVLLLLPTGFFLGKRLVDLNLDLAEACFGCMFHGIVMVALPAL